jgi:hypothetical protein
MELNELTQKSHQMAKDKGWWDLGRDRHPLELHALIHSEIAEATEAVRAGQLPFFIAGHPYENEMAPQLTDLSGHEDSAAICSNGHKPEGEAVELADAIIRIADLFAARGWDLDAVVTAKMAYNATRPIRHGGKLA